MKVRHFSDPVETTNVTRAEPRYVYSFAALNACIASWYPSRNVG